MPLYNAEQFVETSVLSVINQTYTTWELIIVDDGSTDNSLKVVSKYASDKIIVVSQKNSGACVARNKALSLAKGEYVKFLDADDVLAIDCLEKQIEQIATLKEYQIPFGDYNYIDGSGKVISEYKFNFANELQSDQDYFFFAHWEVLITCPLYRLEKLRKIGGFDEKLKRGQETDLHFRLALSGVEFVSFDTFTFSYRTYQSTDRISSNKAKLLQEYYRYIYAKNEKLLLEKYGKVPTKYQPTFHNYYFGEARRLFDAKNKAEGIVNLEKAKSFYPHPLFFKVYYYLGKLMGYCFLESIFQLRLTILKKT